jgi:hypothetical protein
MPKKKEKERLIGDHRPFSYPARKITRNEPRKEGIQAYASTNVVRVALLYSARPKIIGKVRQFPER